MPFYWTLVLSITAKERAASVRALAGAPCWRQRCSLLTSLPPARGVWPRPCTRSAGRAAGGAARNSRVRPGDAARPCERAGTGPRRSLSVPTGRVGWGEAPGAGDDDAAMASGCPWERVAATGEEEALRKLLVRLRNVQERKRPETLVQTLSDMLELAARQSGKGRPLPACPPDPAPPGPNAALRVPAAPRLFGGCNAHVPLLLVLDLYAGAAGVQQVTLLPVTGREGRCEGGGGARGLWALHGLIVESSNGLGWRGP